MKKKQSFFDKKRIISALELICIIVFAACAVFLLTNGVLDYKSKKNMKQLRETIKAARIQSEVLPGPDKTEDPSEDDKSEEATEAKAANENATDKRESTANKTPLFEAYASLHEENENFHGWLSVADTDIDYPVMQGPDNEFYLCHDFNRKYDKYGMLLMDYNCSEDLEVPHYIVYGHNVSNGKYFGELMFYGEKAYYDYHPIISYDSIYENREFEVFAVFNITVSEAREKHLFTSWSFEEKNNYDSMVAWAKDKSMYDTGITPEYGSAILTLVTCEYSQDEGRFIVMASEKKEQNDK